jgi:hypothetical protein
MLLYNVTVGLDQAIEIEWVSWMKSKHIPDVLNTGMFVSAKMYKVLHDQEDQNAVSYSVQYFAKSIEDVQLYLDKFAHELREEQRQRYPNNVAFRTLLEEV